MTLSESSSSSLNDDIDPERTNENSDKIIMPTNNNLSSSPTSSTEQPPFESKPNSKPNKPNPPIYTKLHSMTICMVPAPENKDVWEKVTKARTELRDPGLFRWPPHVNMLYPYIDILNPKIIHNDNHNGNDVDDNNHDNCDMSTEKKEEDAINQTLDSLQSAVHKCQPFRVSLDSFGTFGGNNRGVLYLNPRSFRSNEDSKVPEPSSLLSSTSLTNDMNDDNSSSSPPVPPLVELQSILEHHFPNCYDQRKNGKYTPHMTLSHFPSLESAIAAKEKIEQWWTAVEFDVNEVYVLKRVGDGGQFKIVATLALGKAPQVFQGTSSYGNYDNNYYRDNIRVHDPPLTFPDMPTVEEDWVHEERMKLKERRNGKNGNRRRRSGRRKKKRIVDRGPSRSTDTPEEIARKRAERAAKRERLAKEIELLEKQTIFGELEKELITKLVSYTC